MPTDVENKGKDPYVESARQEVPVAQKIKEFQSILAAAQTCMLTSVGENGVLHARAMAPASKEAPFVFEFLANNVSGKFKEVGKDADVNVSVYDTNTTNWISVGGKSRVSDDRARIKECWSPIVAGWFGDLGDGVHKGDENDPRVSLIVVEPVEIRYWYKDRTMIGHLVDVAVSAVQGKVENSGYIRTITPEELKQAKASQ